MIYLFRIITDEDQDFFRDVVADGSDTFLELHQSLQENLGYDALQLASFFITNEHWEKQQEITLIDMMQDPGLSTITMEGVRLEEHISEINPRMIYVFDFFSERVFFIELVETSDQTSSRETPFIAKSAGEAPPQLALDNLLDDPDVDMDDPDLDPDNPDVEREGFESEDGYEDLRLDDLDPDMFDTGMPEDY